jgi:hypothetical protein
MYEALVTLATANNRTLAGQCRAIFDQALANPGTVSDTTPKVPALEPQQDTITWIKDGSLPDSDTTVLLCTDVGDVGEAFHDGDDWRWASSDIIGTNRVKAWADMPEGPKP